VHYLLFPLLFRAICRHAQASERAWHHAPSVRAQASLQRNIPPLDRLSPWYKDQNRAISITSAIISLARRHKMDLLSDDELLIAVLGFVPPVDLLRSTAYVSRRFAAVVGSEEFWRFHPLVPPLQKPQLTPHNSSNEAKEQRSPFPPLTKHQLQRCCLYVSSIRGGEAANIPACLEAGTVLTSRRQAHRLRSRPAPHERRACAASSTDHWNEMVENLLPEGTEEEEDEGNDGVATAFDLLGRGMRQWFGGLRGLNANVSPTLWWSSAPSPRQDSNDTLLFVTKHALALISSVKIKALQDPYLLEENPRVYSWNRTIVRAYRLPLEALSSEDDPHNTTAGFPCSFAPATAGGNTSSIIDFNLAARAPPDQATIDQLLAQGGGGGATLVYESCFDDPVGGDRETTLVLSKSSGGVVANVITLTLVGKRFEQRTGLGYYACVERVDCTGIPLYQYPNQPNEVREARLSQRNLTFIADT